MRIRLFPSWRPGGDPGGCGSSDSSARTIPPSRRRAADGRPTASASAAQAPSSKVTSSDYGRILADGRGRALDLFTADRGKQQLLRRLRDRLASLHRQVASRSPAGSEAGPDRTTRRDDGELQATYAGHPVYYYVGDNEPGEVLCQAVNEFGGYWYVLPASGKAGPLISSRTRFVASMPRVTPRKSITSGESLDDLARSRSSGGR